MDGSSVHKIKERHLHEQQAKIVDKMKEKGTLEAVNKSAQFFSPRRKDASEIADDERYFMMKNKFNYIKTTKSVKKQHQNLLNEIRDEINVNTKFLENIGNPAKANEGKFKQTVTA